MSRLTSGGCGYTRVNGMGIDFALSRPIPFVHSISRVQSRSFIRSLASNHVRSFALSRPITALVEGDVGAKHEHQGGSPEVAGAHGRARRGGVLRREGVRQRGGGHAARGGLFYSFHSLARSFISVDVSMRR